jgi:N utilization substance protein A
MEIDIFRELSGHEDDEEDVDLMEFTDVIEPWILEEFRRVGMDTARSVLSVGKKDLIRRTDLEEETIDSAVEVFQKEFD